MIDFNESDSFVETTAVSTVITQAHMSIGDAFLARVRDMINSRAIEIKNYGVTVGEGSWSSDQECLTLKTGDKTTLSITLSRGK